MRTVILFQVEIRRVLDLRDHLVSALMILWKFSLSLNSMQGNKSMKYFLKEITQTLFWEKAKISFVEQNMCWDDR